jgi:D-tyrosyl-tRNA(Tyr) deacylase
MRLVVQRVARAAVTINGKVVGQIGRGLAVLVGVKRDDTIAAADRLAEKVATLRIFNDAEGKMNLSIADVGGAFLVVSQFTLYADLRRGRRPSFINAADPVLGEALYERFIQRLRDLGHHVESGRFGAEMLVAIHNDGPVTIIVDSEELW